MKTTFAILALGTFSLAACAPHTPMNASGWVNAEGSTAGADQAFAECRYEGQRDTATIGSQRVDGDMQDAVDAGVEDGINTAYAQTELMRSCMAASGYRPA